MAAGALIFASATIIAQDNWRERKTMFLQPGSTSPFALARVIRNSTETSPVDLRTVWHKLGVAAEYFETCSGECEAKTYRRELDNRPGREVILELSRSWDVRRFLVYTKVSSSRRWKLLGYIDHDFNRYWMAKQRVVRAFGRNWLVIRGQEGSGSGYSLYGETWYRVTAEKVHRVLHYPVDGHTAPWPTGVGWDFKGRVISNRSRNADVLDVRYKVAYEFLDYFEHRFDKLFANRHHVYYVRDTRTNKFVFDSARSNISETELNAIAGIESEDEPEVGTAIGGSTFYTQSEATTIYNGGYQVFLKYNSRSLLKIAAGRDARRKQWLRGFLKDCEASSEKKALVQALQN